MLQVPYNTVDFNKSFNVSVSAAICISHLANKLRLSDVDWKLSEEEKDEIRMKWVRLMVKKSDVLERNFLKKSQSIVSK